MTTIPEPPASFEERLVAYERARRQKHSADHLSPQQILVLRRVVNQGCLERHALISPELCDPSLSRTVSCLVSRNLVRATMDSRDRRKRILYKTKAGEKLLARLDEEAAALNNPSADTVQPASSTPNSAILESSGPEETDALAAASTIQPQRPEAAISPTKSASRSRRARGHRRGVRIGPGQIELDFPASTDDPNPILPPRKIPTPADETPADTTRAANKT